MKFRIVTQLTHVQFTVSIAYTMCIGRGKDRSDTPHNWQPYEDLSGYEHEDEVLVVTPPATRK